MKESTGYYIIFGAFALFMASGFAFRKYEGDTFIKDCQSSNVVRKVESCASSRSALTCTVTTENNSFRTDVTDWPGSILLPGDEIYTCSRATRLRDLPGKAACKNGSCYY